MLVCLLIRTGGVSGRLTFSPLQIIVFGREIAIYVYSPGYVDHYPLFLSLGSSVNENACSSQPCLNGGSCLTMEGDYYVCLCSTDYVGIDCGTPKGNFGFL